MEPVVLNEHSRSKFKPRTLMTVKLFSVTYPLKYYHTSFCSKTEQRKVMLFYSKNFSGKTIDALLTCVQIAARLVDPLKVNSANEISLNDSLDDGFTFIPKLSR